ncbi:LysM peptidoglycan-binding domain-containing protein, partial [Hydrogenibacillus schlegelii]
MAMRTYGTKAAIAWIREANGLKDNTIFVGQTLLLPDAPPMEERPKAESPEGRRRRRIGPPPRRPGRSEPGASKGAGGRPGGGPAPGRSDPSRPVSAAVPRFCRRRRRSRRLGWPPNDPARRRSRTPAAKALRTPERGKASWAPAAAGGHRPPPFRPAKRRGPEKHPPGAPGAAPGTTDVRRWRMRPTARTKLAPTM